MRRYYFTWVTSAHHVVHSSHAKLRDDRQAEDFARDILSAADPSIFCDPGLGDFPACVPRSAGNRNEAERVEGSLAHSNLRSQRELDHAA